MRLSAFDTIAKTIKAAAACALLFGSFGMLAGCETKSFFDPGEVGRWKPDPLVVRILDNIDPSIEEPDERFANAVDPGPEEAQANSADYLISPNDQLSVSISDLQGAGVETVKQIRVSESGNISLPYIGPIHAEGATEIDLEQMIVDAYRTAGIIQKAVVSVAVVEARGRAFNILGQITRPGAYQILQSDFRLLDAITLAGDTTSPLIETVYILRRTDRRRPTTEPTTGMSRPTTVPAVAPDEFAPRSDARTHANHPLQMMQAPADAGDDMAPGAVSPPRTGGDATNRTMERAAEDTNRAGVTANGTEATPARAPGATFEFNELPEPKNLRVIRIPMLDLRQRGRLKYNIPILARDTIIVAPLTTGEYYMGGHITSPGAYSLNGRSITLKQAVIAARMLDGLAIPQRTDIIRRLGPNREVFVRVDLDKIFAGTQPDVFLKPYDVVDVGTNFLAPFLAAVRGGFRMTYGFGFLYDRNYAPSNNNRR